MKKTVCALVTAALLFMMLCSCSSGVTKQEADKEGEIRIVTSFYPVYVTVMNLTEGVEGIAVENLTPFDIGCLHDYKISPNDLRKLTGTKLFLASGKGMEPFVGMSSLGVPGLELLDCGEDISYIIEDEKERENSHYWMNPSNQIEQVHKIKRALCRLDAKNAELYTANAMKYEKRILELGEELNKFREKLQGKRVCIYHDSLEYFTEYLGMKTKIIPVGADSEEVAKIMGDETVIFVDSHFAKTEEFKKLIKKSGYTAIVTEALTEAVEGGSEADVYVNAIRHNLAALGGFFG